MTLFRDYLNPALVVFSEETTRDGVLSQLVKKAKNEEKIPNEEDFLEAVLSREKIVTTGIGMGVAIPHAKISACHNFFIAIALLKQGVAWNSLDGSSVRMVFMIGGPDDKQTEYLKLLSSLTHALKSDSVRKQLLQAQTPQEVCHLLGD